MNWNEWKKNLRLTPQHFRKFTTQDHVAIVKDLPAVRLTARKCAPKRIIRCLDFLIYALERLPQVYDCGEFARLGPQ